MEHAHPAARNVYMLQVAGGWWAIVCANGEEVGAKMGETIMMVRTEK